MCPFKSLWSTELVSANLQIVCHGLRLMCFPEREKGDLQLVVFEVCGKFRSLKWWLFGKDECLKRKLRSVSWLWIKVILLLRYLGASLKTHVFYVESWSTRMWPIHECDAISRTLALCCWILLWNTRKERARLTLKSHERKTSPESSKWKKSTFSSSVRTSSSWSRMWSSQRRASPVGLHSFFQPAVVVEEGG